MTPRICKICSGSLDRYHLAARYCSPECRAEGCRRYATAYYRNIRAEVCYKVVFDPTGDFPVGNKIKAAKETVALGYFDGMVLEKAGVNYEVRGKKMVKI